MHLKKTVFMYLLFFVVVDDVIPIGSYKPIIIIQAQLEFIENWNVPPFRFANEKIAFFFFFSHKNKNGKMQAIKQTLWNLENSASKMR